MKSGSLCALLWRILSWCTRKPVTFKARHIPGWLNVIANKLSRLGQTIQTEWSLHPEVFQAICLCTRKQVTLKAHHMPGLLNVIADKLSRLGQTIQTEWSLHPEVFQAICSQWHQSQVDLFATRFNNKLSQFVSPVPDPQAWAVDALSLSWEN